MTTSCHTVLVLWGKGFDEIAAAIFVAELRRLGKRVKLVGLNSQHLAGQHGVALVPDLPLGQALRSANEICCLIVPAPLAALRQFSYDPRIAELLGLATDSQALFVVHHTQRHKEGDDFTESSPFQLPPFLVPSENVLAYPPAEELLTFVQGTLIERIT